ncbi:MAG: hypothetical protein ACP5OA_01210 [Candidatus Woesearchaeota archaeon]
MLKLDTFPEIENIDALVIREDHFNSSLYESVKSAFPNSTLENPYAATKKIKNYASELKHRNETKSVESLANALGKNDTSLEKLAAFFGSKQRIGEYFDTSKIETRNARELFEYSMKNKKVPLVCLEHTLLVLAMGNSMGLNVGASMVPTFKTETNGTVEGNSEEHREHIVPVFYVKKDNGKYAALTLDIVSKDSDLFRVYPDSFPVDSNIVVLSYLNNFSNSLLKKINIIHNKRQALENLLSQNIDIHDILLRNKAVKLYFNKKYEEALPLFEKLEKQYEDMHGNSVNSHGEAKLYLAKCLIRLDKLTEAEAKFSEFFPNKEHELWKLIDPNNKQSCRTRFEEYRGVDDSKDIAQGMVMWAHALKEKYTKENKVLNLDEFDNLYRLYNSALDLGFYSINAFHALLELSYEKALKDNSHINTLTTQIHKIGKCLFDNCVAASKNTDVKNFNESQSNIQSFLYNMIHFYASSSMAQYNDYYIRKNLPIIVTNNVLRDSVVNDDSIKKLLPDKVLDDILKDNPIDKPFDLNTALKNVPYALGGRSFEYLRVI